MVKIVNSSAKKTASTQVYEYILAGLIERRYPPGTPLREERFCEECDCSATPVREAFRQLEKEGWLTNLPYRGCIVRVLDEAEVTELFFLREAIESRAARAIVENGRVGLAPLEAAVAEMALKIENGCPVDALKIFHDDLRFHRALLEIAQLPRLATYAGVWDSQLRSFPVSDNWMLSQEEALDVLEQHRSILSALKRGWLRSAESLVRDHIDQARQRTLVLMRDNAAAAEVPRRRKRA